MDYQFQPNRPTVMYVDANNLYKRAFFAAESDKDKALEFLMNMAWNLRSTLKTEYLFAVFDGENAKESRLAFLPYYKANRLKDMNNEKVLEQEFREQEFKMLAKEALAALNFNVYESDYIEADDVIGILAKRSAEKNWNVVCVSSDKDYNQMCTYSPYVNILNQQRKEVTHQGNFQTKLDIRPEQFTDYLALVGDKADNIIGIFKLWHKTAIKLLSQYNDIAGIKEHLQEIKGVKLVDNLEEAFVTGRLERNKKAVSVLFEHQDKVKIDTQNLKKTVMSMSDINRLNQFCKNHELESFRLKNLAQYYNITHGQSKPRQKHGMH